MSKQNEKERKRGISEYLSTVSEIPSDAMCGEVRIELRGRYQLFLTGCRRIIKYSPELMVLAVKGDLLNVSGERLICTSYHGGTVSIEGNILSVRFDGGDT